MQQKTLLFISHDGTRTGAPFVVLHLARWFRENTRAPIAILLRRGGPLESEFAKLGPTLVAERALSMQDGLVKKILNRLGATGIVNRWLERRFLKRLHSRNIQLIYSSTVTNGALLSLLKTLRAPVVSHVHELEFWIRFRTDPGEFKKMLAHTDYYIAGSHAAKNNLAIHHGVPENTVEVIHEFIPVATHERAVNPSTSANIRLELGIPHDAFVVGGAGTTDWRKAPDVFIHLAHEVRRLSPNAPIYFLWVGGDGNGLAYRQLQHDLDRAGLQRSVKFVGARSDYLDYLAAIDVLALVSREDCFPLVILEAALFFKPILCFNETGGAHEFVGNDCGFSVPYFDLHAMAEKIIFLAETPELRETLGRRASEKARSEHDVAIVAPQIKQVFDRILETNSQFARHPSS